MKRINKVIIGIVCAIILLVAVKFTITLRNSTYHADETPEDVAFNYLFALRWIRLFRVEKGSE